MTSPSVNYAPLSPLAFLERSLLVYPNKPAVVYGESVYTYAQYSDRICRLGEALRAIGVGRGDRVAILAPNIPPMLDAKFGPMRIGAILVPLNIRLSAREIAYILNHSGAKVLIFDSELADTVRELRQDVSSAMSYVQIVDARPEGRRHSRAGIRGIPRCGPVRAGAGGGNRRERRDLHQLHVRHDGISEGCRLPRARRMDQRGRRGDRDRHELALGLFVDPAVVPLQRLVLSVGHRGHRRHERLLAQGRARGSLPTRQPLGASRTCAARRPS